MVECKDGAIFGVEVKSGQASLDDFNHFQMVCCKSGQEAFYSNCSLFRQSLSRFMQRYGCVYGRIEV